MTEANIIRLRHILDAIENIESFTKGMSREQFIRDEKTFSAAIYQFHIIGEAMNHIDDDFRAMHMDVPARDIIDLRNKIAHEYFGITRPRIWTMIQKDLPTLKEQVENVIRELGT